MSDAQPPKDAAPPKPGRKKLLIAAIAGTVVLAGGGAGAYFMLKGGDHDEAAAAAKADEKRKAGRVFVTLEPFVVNLADREAERYAQVGLVLEVEGKEAEAKLAAKMPAVRNEILLLISSKRASDLTTREGKEALASQIVVSAARPLGWTPHEDEPEEEPVPKVKTKDGGKDKDKDKDKGKDAKAKAKPKKVVEPVPNPVAAVHFSSFIVQ
jgi:flagellar FliL protein